MWARAEYDRPVQHHEAIPRLLAAAEAGKGPELLLRPQDKRWAAPHWVYPVHWGQGRTHTENQAGHPEDQGWSRRVGRLGGAAQTGPGEEPTPVLPVTLEVVTLPSEVSQRRPL